MNTNGIEFYNPLSIALGSAQLQDFVNEVLAKYNGLEIDGFSFNNDLLPDFTYEQIQREVRIEVMASYVDLDSPAIPVGVEGETLATGKIPRMKAVEYYNEDKLRKLKMLEDRKSVTREALIQTAGVNLADIFLKLVGRHTNSLKYQRHQVVSAGKFTLTDANNPNGIKDITFANHIPSANKNVLAGAKKWWTSTAKSTEGASADPIEDLRKMVKDARKKGIRGHFEVNYTFLDDILAHSKVKAAIAVKLYPLSDSTQAQAAASLLSRDEMKAQLESIIGAPIKSWDSLVSVEKWNNTTKKLARTAFDAFESNVVVFVPDGSLGEILTVEPILLDGGEYAYYYGGKLAITIGKDFVKKCQSYNSEMTSLVVPDKPQYMWYIYPCND